MKSDYKMMKRPFKERGDNSIMKIMSHVLLPGDDHQLPFLFFFSFPMRL